jgi:hypothetical protein
MKTEWGEIRLSDDAFDLTGKKALVIGAGNAAGRAPTSRCHRRRPTATR